MLASPCSPGDLPLQPGVRTPRHHLPLLLLRQRWATLLITRAPLSSLALLRANPLQRQHQRIRSGKRYITKHRALAPRSMAQGPAELDDTDWRRRRREAELGAVGVGRHRRVQRGCSRAIVVSWDLCAVPFVFWGRGCGGRAGFGEGECARGDGLEVENRQQGVSLFFDATSPPRSARPTLPLKVHSRRWKLSFSPKLSVESSLLLVEDHKRLPAYPELHMIQLTFPETSPKPPSTCTSTRA